MPDHHSTTEKHKKDSANNLYFRDNLQAKTQFNFSSGEQGRQEGEQERGAGWANAKGPSNL